MSEFTKLQHATRDELALKDEAGNKVLPFQGGRFSMDDEYRLIDSGIRNRYPRLADVYRAVSGAVVGDPDVAPEPEPEPDEDQLVLVDITSTNPDELMDDVLFSDLDETFVTGSNFDGGTYSHDLKCITYGGTHYAVNYNTDNKIYSYTYANRANMTQKRTSYADVIDTPDDGSFNIEHLVSFGNYAYAFDFTNQLVSGGHITNTALQGTFKFDIFPEKECRGLWGRTMGGNLGLIYVLYKDGSDYLFVRAIVEIDLTTGKPVLKTASVVATDLQETLAVDQGTELMYIGSTSVASHFSIVGQGAVLVTDIFAQIKVDVLFTGLSGVSSIFDYSSVIMVLGSDLRTYKSTSKNLLADYDYDTGARSAEINFDDSRYKKGQYFGVAIYSDLMHAQGLHSYVDSKGGLFEHTCTGTNTVNLYRFTPQGKSLVNDATSNSAKITYTKDGLIGQNFFQMEFNASSLATPDDKAVYFQLLDSNGDVALTMYQNRANYRFHLEYADGTDYETNVGFGSVIDLRVGIKLRWRASEGKHEVYLMINGISYFRLDSVSVHLADLSDVKTILIPAVGNDVDITDGNGAVYGANGFMVWDKEINYAASPWLYDQYQRDGNAAATSKYGLGYVNRTQHYSADVPNQCRAALVDIKGRFISANGNIADRIQVWESHASFLAGDPAAYAVPSTEVGTPGGIHEMEENKFLITYSGNFNYAILELEDAQAPTTHTFVGNDADYNLNAITAPAMASPAGFVGYCRFTKQILAPFDDGSGFTIRGYSLDADDKPSAIEYEYNTGGSLTYGIVGVSDDLIIMAAINSFSYTSVYIVSRSRNEFQLMTSSGGTWGMSGQYSNMTLPLNGIMWSNRAGGYWPHVALNTTDNIDYDAIKADFALGIAGGFNVTESYTRDDIDLKLNGVLPEIVFEGNQGGEDTGGGDDAFGLLERVIVGPEIKYAYDKEIPMSVAAYNVPSLAPVPINIPYLYALSKTPVTQTDEFLLTPGNLLPRFDSHLDSKELRDNDFEWAVYNEETLVDPDTNALVVTLTHHEMGVAVGDADNLLYDMASNTPIEQGTNRPYVLIYLDNGVKVEVPHANLIAYKLGLAKPGDGKEYYFVDPANKTVDANNIALKYQEIDTNTAADDPANDFLSGNE